MSNPEEHVNTYSDMEITEKSCRRQTPRRAVSLVVVLFAVSLFWWGCEGPQGPQGEGVGDLDTEPPTVSWVQPKRSRSVDTDTFSVRVNAADNRGVDYVQFFFDGSSEMGDTTAIDSFPPYIWTWNLDTTGHDFGTYPLMARAFDEATNAADTPTLLLRYIPVPTDTTLYQFDPLQGVNYLTMPDNYGDRFWNVRFAPSDTCRLLEIHFEFRDPAMSQLTGTGDALNGGTDFMIYAWDTDENGQFPVTPPLDSLYISEENPDLNYSNPTIPDGSNWSIFDVSDWNLQFNGPFHAGYSIPSSINYGQLQDDLLAMPIWVTVDDSPLQDPSQHSSIELADGEWGTIQQNWSGNKYDFHIRVMIQYDSGNVAMLTPDGREILLDQVK